MTGKYAALLLSIATTILITGCESDETKLLRSDARPLEKLDQCNQLMRVAISQENKDLIEQIKSEPKCLEAKRKVNADRQEAINRRYEQQELEAEHWHRELESKRKILTSMPFDDFVGEIEKCQFLRNKARDRTPTCKALYEIQPKRFILRQDELIAEYSGDKLLQYNRTSCKGSQYDNRNCNLSKKAIKKRYDDLIAELGADRQKLKSRFNACQSSYQSILTEKNQQEAYKYASTYPCSAILIAGKNVGVYNFKEPMD